MKGCAIHPFPAFVIGNPRAIRYWIEIIHNLCLFALFHRASTINNCGRN